MISTLLFHWGTDWIFSWGIKIPCAVQYGKKKKEKKNLFKEKAFKKLTKQTENLNILHLKFF